MIGAIMRKTFLLLTIFCIAANNVFSQSSPTFTPEVKRVAVFKNGYAFTYREGTTRTQNGWAYTKKSPIGVLGTVWGYSTSPNVRVKQLLASKTDTGETKRVTNIAEFLLANEGKRVRLYLSRGSNEKIETGTYQLLKPDLSSITPLQRRSSINSIYSHSNLQNITIALNTENGAKIFAANLITAVEVIGEAVFALSSRSNTLGFQVEGAKNGQNIKLGVAALERGIRWIPSYRVELKGNPVKNAKFELEANVINELTDLKDSEMYFVVGVPHFLFQDMMSPLSMNTAFAGVSNYFQTRSGGRNTFSNALMTQSVGRNTTPTVGGTPSPTVFDEERLTSFSAEQLFLYKSDQISLKKHERASLRLFSLTVPVTEVFEWTIKDPPDVERRYYSSSSSNSTRRSLTEELSRKVWYALRLKNETGMPWTTAPALTFRDWKPIGQDMLTFTPIGGENILKVTPATEVIGDHTLKETGRERVQLKYGGSTYNFDLITVEATIKIRNIKKETVELVLTRSLTGEILEATANGKISRQGLNLQAVNPNPTVKWNLKLPNGKTEITYTYKVYVRR
jgi:hypothetical protein